MGTAIGLSLVTAVLLVHALAVLAADGPAGGKAGEHRVGDFVVIPDTDVVEEGGRIVAVFELGSVLRVVEIEEDGKRLALAGSPKGHRLWLTPDKVLSLDAPYRKYAEMMKQQPNHWYPRMVAKIHAWKGRFDEFLAEYSKLVETWPDDPLYRVARATLWVQKRQFQRAFSDLEVAIDGYTQSLRKADNQRSIARYRSDLVEAVNFRNRVLDWLDRPDQPNPNGPPTSETPETEQP